MGTQHYLREEWGHSTTSPNGGRGGARHGCGGGTALLVGRFRTDMGVANGDTARSSLREQRKPPVWTAIRTTGTQLDLKTGLGIGCVGTSCLRAPVALSIWQSWASRNRENHPQLFRPLYPGFSLANGLEPDCQRTRTGFWHTLCSLGRTNRVSCQADAAWIVRAATATAGGDCPRELRNPPRAFRHWRSRPAEVQAYEFMPTWAENSASLPGSPLLIRTSEWLSNRSTNQSTHSILQIRFGGC